jgi:hypothetical protein
MKSDFVRHVFNAMRSYVRVILQRGTVQLDADALTADKKDAPQEVRRAGDTDVVGSKVKMRKPS